MRKYLQHGANFPNANNALSIKKNLVNIILVRLNVYKFVYFSKGKNELTSKKGAYFLKLLH